MGKIYESPDGGKTVYVRESGEAAEFRSLLPAKDHKIKWHEYDDIWNEVNGFPDWELLNKYPDLREVYENFLRIQEEYRVLKTLSQE